MGQRGEQDRGRNGAGARPIVSPRVRAVDPVMPAPGGQAGALHCAAGPEEIGRTLLPHGAGALPRGAGAPARGAEAPAHGAEGPAHGAGPLPRRAREAREPALPVVPSAGAAARLEADPFLRRLARLD
jgi:hypothetical protein